MCSRKLGSAGTICNLIPNTWYGMGYLFEKLIERVWIPYILLSGSYKNIDAVYVRSLEFLTRTQSALDPTLDGKWSFIDT